MKRASLPLIAPLVLIAGAVLAVALFATPGVVLAAPAPNCRFIARFPRDANPGYPDSAQPREVPRSGRARLAFVFALLIALPATPSPRTSAAGISPRASSGSGLGHAGGW
jgi:hypothetical protein